MPMNKFPYANCDACPLYNEPSVPSTISTGAGVVFVGEAPGAEEAYEGHPFVGQSGQLLRSCFQAVGGHPEDACYVNTVACRPPGNREPTEVEVSCCSKRLEYDLSKCPSEAPVVALGKTAHRALGVSYEDNGRWTGNVVPTWHPAYVLRKPSEVHSFLRDLEIALRGPSIKDSVPDTKVIHVETLDSLNRWLGEMPSGEWLAVDIETDNVNWYRTNKKPKDPVLMLQMCWDPNFALVLDDIMLYDVPGVIDALQIKLPEMKIVGHNFKFDAVFLRSHFGLVIDAAFDTYLAHYLLNENLPHGLKELAKTELGLEDYEKELISKYLNTKNDQYSKVPFEPMAKYGSLDVAATLLLRKIYWDRLKEQNMLEWPMLNIIMPMSAMLTKVELRGFKVDRNMIETVRTEFQRDMDKLSDELRALCGRPDMNVDSPAQLAEVIYDHYGLPEQNHWKIKPRSTSHGAIEKFKGHPFIDKLLEYRRVSKMKRAYADNIWGFMDPVTDVVHSDFRIPGTEVGRLSVADPALQTIPRPSEYYGALIRSLFIPREGHVIIICDYSQAELRALAALSEEQFLIDVYANNRDLHSEVAIAMFGSDYTKEQRVMCKMFNFAYAYGGTERSFAEDAGLNIQVATEFVRRYDENMPKAKAWKMKQNKLMRENGEVQTIFGRKRRFPLIVPSNAKDAMKASVHMPVASTANDLNCLAAIELDKLGVPIVLLVHDSVIAEVPVEDAERIGQLMKEVMEDVGRKYLPSVTWSADPEIRDRWAPLPTRSN